MNFKGRLKNIFILLNIFLISLPKIGKASDNFTNKNNSLDSIKTSILRNGLNCNNFDEYRFFLLNNKTDNKKELKFISSLQQNTYQKLLFGLIYKKENNFEKQFENLFSLLDTLPKDLTYYEELINVAKTVKKTDLIKNALKNTNTKNNYYSFAKGLIFYNEGNYTDATKIFEKLIKTNFKNSNVYYRNAYAFRGLGDYKKALGQLQQAKKLIHNQKYLPKILNAEGALFYLSDNYDIAKKYYNKAKKLAEQYQNNIELTKSLVNLAIISDDIGDVINARKLFTKALQIAKKINSIELQALVHSELAVSFTYDNHLVKAEKHYNKSLELFEIINNENRLAILYSNLGKIYLTLFNYKFALEAFEKGLQFARQNKRSQILNLTGIADVYANLANYSKALEYYNKAKKISKEINEISSLAEIEEGLGDLQFNLGLPQKALQYFNKAKKISKKEHNIYFTANLFHKFGITYFALDSLDLAEHYLLDAVKLSSESGDIYNELLVKLDLANIFLRKNNLLKSKNILHKVGIKCEDYDFKHLLAKQKLLMAELFKTNNNASIAVKYLQNVIIISKEINDYTILTEANYQLGMLYRDNNDTVKAKQYLINAKHLLDDISRPLFKKQEVQISYFSSFSKIYTSLAELYLAEGNEKKAFEIVDAQRARNTVQHLNNLKIISKIKNKNELKQLCDLDWMISTGIYSDSENKKLKKEFYKLKKKLITKEPSIQKYFGVHRCKKLVDIQAVLDSSEHLILYFTNNEFTEIFHLTKDSFHTKKINVSYDSICTMIENISPFYKNIEPQNEIYFNQDLFSFNTTASNKLYELLVKPILKTVKENSNLIFSLPPEMPKIPIEFLVTKYNKTDSPYNYKNVKYLIEKYNISYIPSGNTFVAIKENGVSPNHNALLIGAPKITNANFLYNIRGALLEDNRALSDLNIIPLEYSKDEIEGIENFLNNTKVFLSEKATEKNFKKFVSSSNIIHLSTHSFLYNNQPLIVFSNSDKANNDGLLERGEITQLNLNADMVVLSSCKSGLGKIDKSEGVLGMQKAFFDAGANSVVVSLWDVNDKYTSILMKDFYNFLSEGYDKTSALRMAKKKFIKNTSSNPYYWAAFILAGNTSKLNINKPLQINIYYYILIILLLLLLLNYYKNKFYG